MKANDNALTDTVILPVPEPGILQASELEIYARFMRHLRHVPNSRMEIKILASIQFVADMLDLTDAQITKSLVDMGLRAPRSALPEEFLNYADAALMRESWEHDAVNPALRRLRTYWIERGEDKFAGFRQHFPCFAPELVEHA